MKCQSPLYFEIDEVNKKNPNSAKVTQKKSNNNNKPVGRAVTHSPLEKEV